ncbi:hypothetical protein [Methylobacterium sp. CM6246]
MMSIAEYKDCATNHLRDEVLKATCLRIIDLLTSTPDEELSLITFQTFANYLNLNEIDDNILRALTLLRGCKPPALELRYMFIEGEEEYEVDTEAALEAISVGYLFDRNDHKIDNADEKLYPFFCISDGLAQIKSARK